MFNSAAHFVARLTEVEKCVIRNASNQDRLDWLYHNNHYFEVSKKIFTEAVAAINEAFRINSQSNVFGCTWKF